MAQLSEATAKAFTERVEKTQRFYVEILHMIEEDLLGHHEFMQSLTKYEPKERKRMLRKAARGAARDLLPISTEAIMTFTANARAIWNMTYLRASVHAESVIRAIYIQVLKIMEKELPELFKGIKYETLWDGSTAAILPRDKL